MRFVFFRVQSSNLSIKEFSLDLSPFPIWFLFTLEGVFSLLLAIIVPDTAVTNMTSLLWMSCTGFVSTLRKMQVCAAASGSKPHLFTPLKLFQSFQIHWWSTEQKPTVVIKCKWLTLSFEKKEITILLQPANRTALSPKTSWLKTLPPVWTQGPPSSVPALTLSAFSSD